MPYEGFWLQSIQREKCLQVKDGSIIGAKCSSSTPVDMLWIWTGTRNRQLMNVKTLQCLKRPSRNSKKVHVFMTSCRKRYSDLQNMTCTGGKLLWKQFALTNNAYLHLRADNYAISKRNTEQTWKSSKKLLCGPKISYTGTTLYLSHSVVCDFIKRT